MYRRKYYGRPEKRDRKAQNLCYHIPPGRGQNNTHRKAAALRWGDTAAGSVKGKATARHAVSDWMELEKQRGISITSSVMQFEYEGYCINILDTPRTSGLFRGYLPHAYGGGLGCYGH